MSGTGTSVRTGNPFLGGRAAAAETTADTSRAWLATALSVVLNLVTLVGVIWWGWPPGNVYLLFWIENVVLGLVTIPRVATARGSGSASPVRITVGNIERPAASTSSAGLALFFTFHYGLFCLVHGVFTGFVAYSAGVRLSFGYLGLPVILIVIRYTVELGTTWFGGDPSAPDRVSGAPATGTHAGGVGGRPPTWVGQRWMTTPSRAMMQPYPRILVLHFAVIVAFGITISRINGGQTAQDWQRFTEPLLRVLPHEVRTTGVLAVVILLVIKTVVDVITTRRALH